MSLFLKHFITTSSHYIVFYRLVVKLRAPSPWIEYLPVANLLLGISTELCTT